jgi:P4 family phage/plasmid primase-like protien
MKSTSAMMTYSQFMKTYIMAKKTDKDTDGLKPAHTNSRIGSTEHNIYGGTYCIPDDKYDEFMRLYYHHVFVKKHPEHLTEKQFDRNGPILVDFDLRYAVDVTERLHTQEHIDDLICLYLDEIKLMFQMDEETPHFPVFVMEKPTVNRLESKGVTKDGLHIIFGLQTDHVTQSILRDRVLAKIAGVWSDLPLTNTWAEVLDEGITRGHTNWQLYGSCKPGFGTYRLTRAYDVYIDASDGEMVMNPVSDPQSVYETADRLVELSARYTHHPALLMRGTFRDEYNRRAQGTSHGTDSANTIVQGTGQGMGQGTGGKGMESIGGTGYGQVDSIPIKDILNIRNHEELTVEVQKLLDSIDSHDYALREAYEYTMILPKSYYGPGSFTQWIRVGWTLRNISPRLFVVWIAFSAKYDGFCFSQIQSDLWERWQGFDTNHPHGLTKKSLMFWARQDNPTAYDLIRQKSVEFYIDLTLDNTNNNSWGGGGPGDRAKGCGDYDIATVLYHLYKNEYVCVSVKNNIWYRFRNHKWTEIDSGTTLRRAISEELRGAYIAASRRVRCELLRMKETANMAVAAASVQGMQAQGTVQVQGTGAQAGTELPPKVKAFQERMETVCKIIERLSKTNDKKNIMIEAKELFFDGQFMEKLDTNPYLLCFNNGVIDFKQNLFRKGIPDDCISKTTNIDYTPLDPAAHGKIMGEIEDFMHKLFPCPELHDYMWEHLASVLIGVGLNQTFNMYIGIGQNGKSVLVSLMEHVLGEYKGDVPLTMLTQQRTKVGGLAPELVQLKGIRYAVMQEPSKGDRINEGIMKQVTGGDPIQARAPYMIQTLSFIPQFKLVVCSNEFMEIRSNDHGTWRRVRVVDFESLFTEVPRTDDPSKPHQFLLDKKIKERFVEWAPVFAAMLVQRAYQTAGNVTDCDKVLSSSLQYRERENYISEFLQEIVEASTVPGAAVTKTRLRTEFREWFNQTQGGSYKSKLFNDVLAEMERRYGKMVEGGTEFRGCVLRIRTRDGAIGGGSDNGSITTDHSTRDNTMGCTGDMVEEMVFEEM